MNTVRHAPFAAPNAAVATTMRRVLLALSPGIIVYTGFYGWGLLIQMALASVAALAFEAIMLKLRHRPIALHLSDYSALVTAWLLALCLPPLLPWWMTVLAIGFAIIIAKHLYGGLGHNPFNPAMVGYAVLLVSFPREMTQWLPQLVEGYTQPDFIETLSIIFSGSVTSHLDGMSTATPLDYFKHTPDALMDIITGRGWEWVSLCWLLGGLWLAFKGTLDWRIPTSLLLTVGLFVTGLSLLTDNPAWQNPLFHMLYGGTLLAAFFIATDPVTAATTQTGRWIYAAGIGVLAMIIRLWGGYPDGFAFAILLMNLAAPMIDYLTIPRAYGHK